jgi:hypothetical protein
MVLVFFTFFYYSLFIPNLSAIAALLEIVSDMTLCNLWRDSRYAGNCRPTDTAE